jgi:hypothetical protein
MPRQRGEGKLGRLIFLADAEKKRIILIWFYTHVQFPVGKGPGRPHDRDLERSLSDALCEDVENSMPEIED